MILKCQRVIYSRLMPDMVVAVYKKIPLPCRSGQGRGCLFLCILCCCFSVCYCYLDSIAFQWERTDNLVFHIKIAFINISLNINWVRNLISRFINIHYLIFYS